MPITIRIKYTLLIMFHKALQCPQAPIPQSPALPIACCSGVTLAFLTTPRSAPTQGTALGLPLLGTLCLLTVSCLFTHQAFSSTLLLSSPLQSSYLHQRCMPGSKMLYVQPPSLWQWELHGEQDSVLFDAISPVLKIMSTWQAGGTQASNLC